MGSSGFVGSAGLKSMLEESNWRWGQGHTSQLIQVPSLALVLERASQTCLPNSS